MKERSFACFLVTFALATCSYARTVPGQIGEDHNVVKVWCIANAFANPDALRNDIKNICNHLDCSSIRPGGACFHPNNVRDHASAVFNLYYRAHGSTHWACQFGGDAMISLANPSHGSCIFP